MPNGAKIVLKFTLDGTIQVHGISLTFSTLNFKKNGFSWRISLLFHIGFCHIVKMGFLCHQYFLTFLLKVSYFRKDILKFSFAPKTEQKYFFISALASKKRSNQRHKGTLYHYWRILFWLPYTIFLIWPLFLG